MREFNGDTAMIVYMVMMMLLDVLLVRCGGGGGGFAMATICFVYIVHGDGRRPVRDGMACGVSEENQQQSFRIVCCRGASREQ